MVILGSFDSEITEKTGILHKHLDVFSFFFLLCDPFFFGEWLPSGCFFLFVLFPVSGQITIRVVEDAVGQGIFKAQEVSENTPGPFHERFIDDQVDEFSGQPA